MSEQIPLLIASPGGTIRLVRGAARRKSLWLLASQNNAYYNGRSAAWLPKGLKRNARF